jgi:hypothetical protein
MRSVDKILCDENERRITRASEWEREQMIEVVAADGRWVRRGAYVCEKKAS